MLTSQGKLIFLSALGLLAPLAAAAATACCDNSGSCTTVSGTTSSGLHWCYGYHAGPLPWSSTDNDAAKCLTNLHYTQNSACITLAGSSCDKGNSPEIVSAHDSFITGNHQLSSDDSLAIQAAMDDALAQGLMWSDDTSIGPGYVLFSHVADNGSGIHGLEIYKKNTC